jgi:hypothetical protein
MLLLLCYCYCIRDASIDFYDVCRDGGTEAPRGLAVYERVCGDADARWLGGGRGGGGGG